MPALMGLIQIPVGAAVVDSLAAAPNVVSTLAPLRALTWKPYSVSGVSPVAVVVSHSAAVCQSSDAPKVPSACRYWLSPVRWIANSVAAGLPFALTATSRVVAVALSTVGAAGTLAKVVKFSSLSASVVSTPFTA